MSGLALWGDVGLGVSYARRYGSLPAPSLWNVPALVDTLSPASCLDPVWAQELQAPFEETLAGRFWLHLRREIARLARSEAWRYIEALNSLALEAAADRNETQSRFASSGAP